MIVITKVSNMRFKPPIYFKVFAICKLKIFTENLELVLKNVWQVL